MLSVNRKLYFYHFINVFSFICPAHRGVEGLQTADHERPSLSRNLHLISIYRVHHNALKSRQ